MIVLEKKPKINIKKIPPYLIYEELDGKLLPYKGFRDVLKGIKKIEDIMGSSSLQAFIVSYVYGFIFNKIDRKKYFLFTNEAGLHVGVGDNLANDIAIVEKENLVFNEKYFNKAPKIAIEVDVKIDLSLTEWTNEWDYVIAKSNKMLDFGTEKVIWITTKSKKIFVSSKTERWYLVDFHEDIPLFDGCVLNLQSLLDEEEVKF
jgi:Uma2 family endonuclease